MGKYDDYKRLVLQYSQELTHKGYLVGTGGNLSMRIEGEDAVAITPSSRDYLGLCPEDICIVDWNQQVIEGELKPSVETGMHTAVYKHRLDVNAIVHTHQPYASIFSLINQPIPALFDEQVMNLGNVIEVVKYGVSGSVDLLTNIDARLDNQCNAYILQNHGALCLGTRIEEAARNVELLEKCARVYYYALTTGKEITRLPAEMEEAIFELHKGEQRQEIRRKKKASRAALGSSSTAAQR